MEIDWKDLQYSLKQLHISLTDVQNKEIEMQKILNSSLNLYYKCKRKILLYIENSLAFLGLHHKTYYTDRIKVEIKTANKDELYIFGPLKSYLLLFRNNVEYLFKFITFLTPEEQSKIAFLLMHFFYEDITVNESSDVLNLIYSKLLYNELNDNCDSFYMDNYINPKSFTAKMTNQLIHRNEIKLYMSHIISDLLNEFEEFCENNYKINITLDVEFLDNCLQKKKIIYDFEELSDKKLMKSKTSFQFKRKEEDKNSLFIRKNLFGVPEKKEKGIHILSNEEINQIIKEEFDYTEKNLKNYMKKIDNNIYKLIYLRQLKQINNANCNNIFSLKTFKEKIKKNSEYNKLFSYYNQNLIVIKKFISSIIGNIIRYKDFTPKLIKTAYKAFYSFFHVNYQNANIFDVNLFMINFLFENIIIPTLEYPEKNELLVKEKIFNYKTHRDLLPIINILRHIAQCNFFIEDDYKMLNTFVVEQHYFLQNFFIDITSGFEQQLYLDQMKTDNIFLNENYQTMCLSGEEIKIFINHFKEMEFQDDNDDFSHMVGDSGKITQEKKTDIKQFFVFTNLNYNSERQKSLIIEKKKEKNTSFVRDGEEMLFVENIKNCINYVLVNLPPIPNELTNAEFGELFNRLNDNINYHKDEYKDTFGNKNIPLSWYSNYIINIMEKLPEKYTKNDYLLLFNEMNNEIKDKKVKIANKNNVLSIDLLGEINTFKKMVKIYKYQLNIAKALDLNSKVAYFIKKAELPICLMTANDKFESIRDLFGPEATANFKDCQDKKEILIETHKTCLHSKYESKNPRLNMAEQTKLKNLKSLCHVNNIKEFVNKIQQYIGDITADIFSRINDKSQKDITNITKANEVFEKYINFIDDILKEKYRNEFFSSKEEKSADKKQKLFLKKIQSYILRKISLSLRRHESSYFIIVEDNNFHKKCVKLRWLDPVDHLSIDPTMVSNVQINLGRDLIKRMDKERAGPKIIKYFSKAVNLIVKMITFTTGREDISIDDFLPIMVYLFISVGPMNVISNFGIATYFLLTDEENENTGYSLANIEGCINFIKRYDEEKCKMKKEEFRENCEQSLKSYGIENNNEQMINEGDEDEKMDQINTNTNTNSNTDNNENEENQNIINENTNC